MKKIKKILFRKKYSKVLTPIIGIFLIMISVFTIKRAFAEVQYVLITDDNNIRWQVSYDPNQEYLDVSFFDSENSLTEITVPSISELQSKNSSLPSNITSLNLVNYNYVEAIGNAPDFNSQITKLDLSNVNNVTGVNPIINPNIEAEIIFNNSGTEIGKDAFRNRKLKLKNADKITKVYDGAFYNVTFNNTKLKLTGILPDNQIGVGAFENTNIIELETNAKIINTSAFKNCTSLVKVKLGDETEVINASAFEKDVNLETINFNNVKTIGNLAFKYCNSLNPDFSNTIIQTIGDGAFWGVAGFTKAVTIPDSVIYLGWRAFHGSNIKSLNLNKITSIGAEAFAECQELSEIDFGKVENINWKAFDHCPSLTQINFSDTVKYIEERAFYGCNITDVDFANVERLDALSFANNKFEVLNLNGKKFNVIDGCVFDDNPINKVVVSYDTTNVYNQLGIILGANVKDYVKTVELIAPYDDDDVLLTNRSYSGCYYAISDSNDTNTSTGYGNAMGYRNVTKSGYLFDMFGLEEIIVGEGYEFIGAGFAYTTDTQLRKVTLPSTLKGIGSYAFLNTFNKNTEPEINIPESVEYIGYGAFANSYGLSYEIDLPHLKYVGYNAFSGSGIKKFVFNDELVNMQSTALYTCEYLKEIVFDCDYFAQSYQFPLYCLWNSTNSSTPNNYHYDLIKFTNKVKTNPGVASLFIGFNVDTIDMEDAEITITGLSMFQGAIINTLKLPKNLQTIQPSFYKAFITNPLVIPETVTTIGPSAFNNAEVTIEKLPDNLLRIESGAFYDCFFNDNVVIPRKVNFIGPGAFAGYNYPYSSDFYKTGYTNGVMSRKSFTFLNQLNASVTNGQRISDLLWSTSVDELIFGNNVTELPSYKMNINATPDGAYPEFYRMNIRKISFKNLKILPKKAFFEVSGLEIVDFSKDTNLTTIEEQAFYSTHSLKKVLFHKDSEITVKKQAFYNSGLESIGPEDSGIDLVNNKLIVPDTCAFQQMQKLKYVELNSNFNNGVITDGAFANCYYLDTAILHEDITKVEKNAFYGDTYWNGNIATTVPNTNSSYDYDYNYNTNKSLVIYGNPIIETNTPTTTVTSPGSDGYSYIYIRNYLEGQMDGTITLSETNTNNSITYNLSDLPNNVQIRFNKQSVSNSVVATLNNTQLVNLYYYSYARQINITRPPTVMTNYNMYCYSDNELCKNFYENYKNSFNYVAGETRSLYYLDEVFFIDSNKRNVDMLPDNSDIDKDGLEFYGLRRDGVVLVADENGVFQEAVRYSDGDITLPTYHPTVEDPSRRVFDTPKQINELNTSNTSNFENLEYRIGEEDPDSGRIYVSFNYTNTVGNNSVVTNVLKTKGNYADIIYSDGCGGELFGTVVYDNILVGSEAPEFDGFSLDRPGYEFLGWDKEIEDPTTGDIVYTATWKKLPTEEDDDDDYFETDIPNDIIDPKPNDNIFTNPKTGLNILLILAPIITLFIGYTYITNKKRQLKRG